MTGVFDNESIDLTCPECGHKFKKAVRRIKSSPKFPCPKCGGGFDATEFKRGLRQTDKAVSDFKKSIGRLNLR